MIGSSDTRQEMNTTQTSSSRLEPDVHVSLQPVNALDFEHQVLQSPVPVFVDFTTSWCPPCRVLLPILRQLAAEGAGRFKVVTVDGDESPDLAARFGVRGFPTVIAFIDGREVGRQLGVARPQKLLTLLTRP